MKSLFSKIVGVQASKYKKETLTQVFSCEYCKTFENTYFKEHLRTMASVHKLIHVGITGLFVSVIAGVAAKLLFYVI